MLVLCDIMARSSDNVPIMVTLLKIFICYTLPLNESTGMDEICQGQCSFMTAFLKQVCLIEFIVYRRMGCFR